MAGGADNGASGHRRHPCGCSTGPSRGTATAPTTVAAASTAHSVPGPTASRAVSAAGAAARPTPVDSSARLGSDFLEAVLR
ncbi:hypothetical protein [Kitasatospora sp. NPDC094011]|uniref:hypothetical protein n=1 Tax=Kitasatospora sp. NPDC094011 TaxID=3364090 RepID=UPI00381A8DAA